MDGFLIRGHDAVEIVALTRAVGGIIGDDLCVIADATNTAYLRSECGIIVFLRFLQLGRLGRRGIGKRITV